MKTDRTGFVMVVAIVMLALCGLAITAVLQLARDDVRRTIVERVEAQQRQLLLAGVRDVEARWTAGATPTAGSIAVPAGADATLSITRVESIAADRTTVTFASGALVDEATFVHRDDGWRLSRAELRR